MAIDYNSDKEAHVGHKFIIQKGKTNSPDSVEVNGKEYKFGREGWMRMSDEGTARDIQQKYSRFGDVVVSRARWPHVSDRGHNYFFGSMPEMPWKKNKEGEDGRERTENSDDTRDSREDHDRPTGQPVPD